MVNILENAHFSMLKMVEKQYKCNGFLLDPYFILVPSFVEIRPVVFV